MKLTAAEVKSAAARPGEKPIKLADGGGMFLLINPNGVSGWRLKYRIAGKEKLISLGPYPETTLAEAREKAQEARKQIKTGTDPSAARQADKRERAESQNHTFAKQGEQWLAKWRTTKSPDTINNAVRRLSLLTDQLGKVPLGEIRAKDIATVIERIEESRGPGVAGRCLSVAQHVFRHAKAKGLVENNPAADMAGIISPVKYGHYKSHTSPEGLAEVLRKIESYPSPVVRPFLKILPIIFCRPGELVEMRWDQLDLNPINPEWRYRISKTGTDHIVPLPRQVVAILEELKPLTGNKPFVFAGKSKTGTINRGTIAWALKQSLGVRDHVAHGFRASARTILDEVLGFRPDFIEHQLGHAVRDVNGRAYNRVSHLAERRKMLQVWADYLDELREGTQGANNVVELRRANG